MASRLVSIRAASSKPIWRGYTSLPSASFIRQSQCLCRCHGFRNFSSSAARFGRQQKEYKESFGSRLRKALNETKITWYHIPVGVGIGFLALGQLYRVNEREKARELGENLDGNGHVKSVGSEEDGAGSETQGRPKKRERVRPSGPWYAYL
jgi:phosphatidylserine decarboxylase